MKKENLRIDNLKSGSLLKRIQLQIFAGEITHCIFDNIQEKQAFLRVICGREKADCGKIYLKETLVGEKEILQRLDSSVAVISIESQLIPSITTDENMFLMRPKVNEHWVVNANYKREAKKIFGIFDLSIDLEKPVAKLSDYEKVQIEIMKAYLVEKDVIILTDLSNCLSSIERKNLWILLEQLKTIGKAFIIIEPLEDINFTQLDHIIVVRNGRTCFTKSAMECDYTMLHTVLYHDEIGRRSETAKFAQSRGDEQVQSEVYELTSKYLQNIRLCIPKGHIVKMLCVDEKSYIEIIELFKQRAISEDGIGIVEGNPVSSTLFLELTVMDNLKMLLSKKAKGMWLISRYKKSIQILLQDIIPGDQYGKMLKHLSPQDMQRVVYSRWLLYSPQLLVCIQPFADGDIKAREVAREMLYILEDRGVPLLIVTSNTSELSYCQGREVFVRHGKRVEKEEAYRFLNKEM